MATSARTNFIDPDLLSANDEAYRNSAVFRQRNATTWGDDARTLGVGALGIGSALAAGAQYATGSDEDSAIAAVRRFFQEQSEEVFNNMTPAAQRELVASFLPSDQNPDIFDRDVSAYGTVRRQTIAAIPSLIASLIPGGILGRVALTAGATRAGATAIGTGANIGSAAAQTGGSVFESIQSEILNASEDDLMESQLYAGLREQGVSDFDARETLIREAAGIRPLLQAGVTAATIRLFGGVERGFGGGTLRQRIARGARGEGAQEAVESGTQEVFRQNALVQIYEEDYDYDPARVVDAVLRGGAIGAVTGGTLSAVLGPRPRRDETPPADPTADPLLDPTADTEQDAEGDVDTDFEDDDAGAPAPTPTPAPSRRTDPAASALGRVNGSVETVAPAGGDAAANAALNARQARQPQPQPTLTAPSASALGRQQAAPTPEAPAVPAPNTASAASALGRQRQSAPATPPAPAPPAAPVVTPGVNARPAPAARLISTDPGNRVGPEDDLDTETFVEDDTGQMTFLDSAPVLAAGEQEAAPAPAPADPNQLALSFPRTVLPAVDEASNAVRARARERMPAIVDSFGDNLLGEFRETSAQRKQAKKNETRAAARDADEERRFEVLQRFAPDEAEMRAYEGLAKASPTPEDYERARSAVASSRDRINRMFEAIEAESIPVAKDGRGRQQAVSALISKRDGLAGLRKTLNQSRKLTPEQLRRVAKLVQDHVEAAVDRDAAQDVRDTGRVANNTVGTGGADPVGRVQGLKTLEVADRRSPEEIAEDNLTAALDPREQELVRREIERESRERRIRRNLVERGNEGRAREAFPKGVTFGESGPVSTAELEGEGVVELPRSKRRRFERSRFRDMRPKIGTKGRALLERVKSRSDSRRQTEEAKQTLAQEEAELQAREAAAAALQGGSPISTLTAAFKRWFGDSKVVDSDGKPRIVYHGSSVDIGNAFRKDRSRRGGFWFGAADMAGLYTSAGSYPNLTPVYLSIRNPATVNSANNATLDVEALKAQGFDGAYDPSFDVWIAFEPTQIKSAIGNRGTFDATDSDIRMMLRDDDLLAALESEVEQDSVSADDLPQIRVRIREGKDGVISVGVVETRSLHEVLRNLDIRRMPEGGKVPAAIRRLIRDRILSFTQDIPVHIISDADMDRVDKRGGGFYDGKQGHIALRESDAYANDEAFTHAALHEAVHAALQARIDADPILEADIESLMEEMGAAHGEVFTKSYANTNAQEFMAEALADRRLQEMMANTPISDRLAQRLGIPALRTNTLWRAFIEMVRRAFRLPQMTQTALEGVLATLERAGTQQARGDGRSVVSLLRRDQARDAISRTAQDMKVNWAARLRRFGTAWSLTDPFRQRALEIATYAQSQSDMSGVQFGQNFAKMVEEFQKVTEATNQNAQAGNKLVQEIGDLASRSPVMEQHVENLSRAGFQATALSINFVDSASATQAEFDAANPHLKRNTANNYQAKKFGMRLQKEFEKLPPELRAWHFKAQKYFKGTQRTIASNAIDAILDPVLYQSITGNQLTDAQRADLKARTLSSNLVEADKALVGETIYNYLAGTRQFQAAKGTYYPGMRFGSYVVRGKLKPGDLMGGKLVKRDGRTFVEFNGGTKDASRKLMTRWLDRTQLVRAGDIKIVRYERSTGNILSAADAVGQDVDEVWSVPINLDFVEFFESAADGQRFINEARGDFTTIDPEPVLRVERTEDDTLSYTQFAAIERAIDRLQVNDAGDLNKQFMKLALAQAASTLLPGTRLQHRSIMRRNVKGASRDLVRVMASYVESTASYAARQTLLPKIRVYDKNVREALTLGEGRPGADERSQMYEEMKSRLGRAGTNATAGVMEGPVYDLLRISSFTYLASPGYWFVSSFQTMLTWATLSGRYGGVRTSAAISAAYNTIGARQMLGIGFANMYRTTRDAGRYLSETTDSLEFLRRNLASADDGADLVRAFDAIMERGFFNRDVGLEIEMRPDAGQGVFRTALSRFDRIVRQMPIIIENINRAVTMVAAYRMHKAQNGSHEKAVEFALSEISNTQGDYRNINFANFTQSSVLGRFAFQFKKYSFVFTQLFLGMVKKAYKGATQEEKRIAQRQLGFLFGAHLAMAGAVGLPAAELVKVPMMIAAALGLSDGWEEQERQLRALLAESVGQTPANALINGLPTLIGIDLSGRIGAGDMWTFGEPPSYDADGIASYTAKLLGGAPGSMIFNNMAALNDFGQGNWEAGITKILPVKFLADVSRAYSASDDLNYAEMAARAAGIQPISRSVELEEGRARERESKAADRERRRLTRLYLQADTARERMQLRREIREHNKNVSFRHRLYTTSLDRIRREEARR